MTHFGTIKSYDAGSGVGTITPEAGGEPLGFVKADLRQTNEEPKVDQRFGYETAQIDGGKARAINLHSQRERGEKQKV